ncbi:hypothetical protein D9M70_421290 [compost metagenome]
MAGDGAAVQAPGLFGEPGDETGRVLDLATGLEERLALLQAEDLRKVFLVRQNQLGPAVQMTGALVQTGTAPGRESGLGGIHGGTDLRLVEQRDMADQTLVGGVVHGDAGAALAMDPVAVDIAERLEQQGMIQRHGLGLRSR